MRSGRIAVLAAAMCCAAPAEAARYYEFEMVGGATFGTAPTGRTFIDSTRFWFDTTTVYQNKVSATGPLSVVMAFDPKTSGNVSLLFANNSSYIPVFNFTFDFADVREGEQLQGLNVRNTSYSYLWQYDGRYASTITSDSASISYIRARATDIAPTGPQVQQTVTMFALPEPGTWALMIGGFGVIGAAMRRRPRVRVAFG